MDRKWASQLKFCSWKFISSVFAGFGLFFQVSFRTFHTKQFHALLFSFLAILLEHFPAVTDFGSSPALPTQSASVPPTLASSPIQGWQGHTTMIAAANLCSRKMGMHFYVLRLGIHSIISFSSLPCGLLTTLFECLPDFGLESGTGD